MDLRGLVDKLGIAEVARRLKISISTLRKWLRIGPSNKGSKNVYRIINNHLRAVKGQETRKKKKRIIGDFPRPPELDEDETNDAIPDKSPPPANIDVGAEGYDREHAQGQLTWIRIGQTINQLDFDDIAKQVVKLYEASKREFCQIKYMIYRYISKSSSKVTKEKLGTWQTNWLQSKILRGIENVREEVISRLEGHPSLWALTRVIILELIGVDCFDYTPIGLQRILNRELW